MNDKQKIRLTIDPTNIAQWTKRVLKTQNVVLEQAEAKLRQATRVPPGESNNQPSSVLTNSQRCIEHCAKTLFRLADVQEPTVHTIEIESESGKQLLNAVDAQLNEDFTQRTARVLFLAELYGSTYPVSEYGIDMDSVRIEANDLLDRMESDQAYNHAVEVVENTRDLVDTARTREGMTTQSRESIIDSAFERY